MKENELLENTTDFAIKKLMDSNQETRTLLELLKETQEQKKLK